MPEACSRLEFAMLAMTSVSAFSRVPRLRPSRALYGNAVSDLSVAAAAFLPTADLLSPDSGNMVIAVTSRAAYDQEPQ